MLVLQPCAATLTVTAHFLVAAEVTKLMLFGFCCRILEFGVKAGCFKWSLTPFIPSCLLPSQAFWPTARLEYQARCVLQDEHNRPLHPHHTGLGRLERPGLLCASGNVPCTAPQWRALAQPEQFPP